MRLAASKALVCMLSFVASVVLAATAHADPLKCQRSILKNSGKFAQTKIKALSKCNGSRVKNQSGVCPDSRASDAIVKAANKLRAAVEKSCGGDDQDCGTIGDNDSLLSIDWSIGSCPDFEGKGCTNLIAQCDDIATCLECINEQAIDQAIGLYYDSLLPSTSGTQLNKCQVAIGKATSAFFVSKTKALDKCWDARLNGKHGNSCVPPAVGDDKYLAAIAKAELKKQDNIHKNCDPVVFNQIGFVPSCPSVQVPGGAVCNGPVTNLTELIACVDCVTEFKVDCEVSLAVPGLAPFPPQCAVVPPTPTPTVVLTSTPTPTVTATATVTPTATKTPTATFPPAATTTKTPKPTKTAKATATKTATPTPTPAVAVTATKTATPTSVVVATVTATPTGPLVTATPTTTATPTATATPALCGNGLNDPGEKCDASAPAAGWATCGPDFTCVGCNCACPTKIAFTGDASDPASVLDTGWTGISHRAPIISDGTASVSLSCPGGGTSRPCGVCTVSGPVANGPGKLANQRCTDDTSIHCTDNTPCLAGGGTCQFFFGANLPLAAGGVTVCAVNQFNGPVSGTANVETGDAFTVANLTARVYTGIAIDNPCARCVGDPTNNDGVLGGTCDGGTRIGLTCDGNGTVFNRPDFGTTSLDCPLGAGVLIATLPIDLTNATATVTKTVSASSPQCSGSATERCLCDTCNNLNQEPCDSNAVCPDPAGPIGPICGGRRCLGGTNAGAACTIAAQCSGGTNSGAACTVASQCPGGGCANSRCVGGTNDLGVCAVASACPGGVCNAFCTGDGLCNRPGAATAPSACLDNPGTVNILDCVDGGSGEGTCTQGPVDANCTVASGHAQRGCASAADCGGGVGSCASPNRNCFLTGGFTGSRLGTNTLIAAGMADVPMADTANPTLGAVFCVGPTGAAAVNSVSGLPGPGRTTIKGTAVGKP